jgi:hypothetical protein
LAPDSRATHALVPAAEYDDGGLLAVQRAALRFAAARGDLVVLLGLPRHYRRDEVLAHIARLASGGAPPEFSGPGVPSLSSGESLAMSFGALLHPHIVQRLADRAGEVVDAVPPEGAVAGSLAAATIARGAFVAAANRPLAHALGTDPILDVEDWRTLVPAGANPILARPRGFVLLSEETLSDEPRLRPLHVRRLLILLRRLVLREGATLVFENHGPVLRNLVRHRFETLLASLFARGAFSGTTPAEAFRVAVDEGANPPASVALGRLVVELTVVPAPALERIVVRLVADERGRLAVEEG